MTSFMKGPFTVGQITQFTQQKGKLAQNWAIWAFYKDPNNDRKMGETEGYQKLSIVIFFFFSYYFITKKIIHYTFRYNEEF